MLHKLATMDRIVLYRDSFPLSNNLSFTDFIQALDDEIFFPHVLLVDQIPLTDDYHLEFQPIFFNLLLDRPVFADWKFMDECVLRYSEDKKEVLLKASISTGWFLFYLLFGGGLITILFYAFVVTGMIFSLLLILLTLVPFLILYNRDRHRYQRIRSLASKRE